jgi:hypothetical protein
MPKGQSFDDSKSRKVTFARILTPTACVSCNLSQTISNEIVSGFYATTIAPSLAEKCLHGVGPNYIVELTSKLTAMQTSPWSTLTVPESAKPVPRIRHQQRFRRRHRMRLVHSVRRINKAQQRCNARRNTAEIDRFPN